MTRYLLDANLLIALLTREHVHHERAARWVMDQQEFAVCPIVEGAFVRFAVRMGMPVGHAVRILQTLRKDERFDFWPDSVSYANADMTGVVGHRQVTDAYLAALVAEVPGAHVATLDRGLAQARPQLATLVPE